MTFADNNFDILQIYITRCGWKPFKRCYDAVVRIHNKENEILRFLTDIFDSCVISETVNHSSIKTSQMQQEKQFSAVRVMLGDMILSSQLSWPNRNLECILLRLCLQKCCNCYGAESTSEPETTFVTEKDHLTELLG